jgi:thiosulfate/3-mercaptopyruvate sulfurtransferase
MSDLLIEAPQLLSLMNEPGSEKLILVDLGKEDRFLHAHIPGAVLVTPSMTQAGPPIPGLAPGKEQLTELMQAIGLTPDSHVIVYDDEGGGWAGRFIWLLDEIGHTSYQYLNGGLHAWSAENYALESGPVNTNRSDIQVQLSGKHSVNIDQLKDSLTNQDIQIWDARSPMEHSGETVYAARGGKIPGALNYEWTRAMDQQNHLKLKPCDILLEELAAVGIVPDKPTVTHCQTHHRSGLTYLLGKLLGFKDIKAYPGSWGEWGNQADTPIE